MQYAIKCKHCGVNDRNWHGWQPPKKSHCECLECGHCRTCGINLSGGEVAVEEIENRLDTVERELDEIKYSWEKVVSHLQEINSLMETLDTDTLENSGDSR